MILDLQFFINMFFSFLDFTGFTILSLSIYRIPIMMYWKRLIVIQFVFMAVMLIHDFVLKNKDFYALSIAMTGIVLSIILLRIPFLFSALIWGTGYLLNSTIVNGVVLAITATNIIPMEKIMNEPFYRNLVLILIFIVNLSIVYLMERKRLGFMFIMNRFRLQKRSLQLKDYFIAIFFICVISLIQMSIVSVLSNNLNRYLAIISGSMLVISLIGLYITYKFNMQEVEERFNALRRKKQ